jgi:hypothetical protein
VIRDNPQKEVDDPLIKVHLNKQTKFDTNLIIHYTYEQRRRNNKKDI